MGAPERHLDRFAEALAQSEGQGPGIDGNVSWAARQIGLPPARGADLMAQLRREIGPSQCK